MYLISSLGLFPYTIFDTEAKDIKYVYGKRPKEDIKYITERFTIVKTKVYGTFILNSENEENLSNGIGIFTRSTPTRLRFNSDDEDFVPAYRQEEIISEIYGPMNFVYSMSGVSEVWNYIRLHPTEIEDILVIEDGKISHQTGHIATKEEKSK